jgi:hypothetical protein
MRAALLFAALVLASCTARSVVELRLEDLSLDPPPSTYLVAVETSSHFSVTVVEAGGEGASALPAVEDADEAVVTVIAYQDPRASLGIARVGPISSPGAHPVPPGGMVYRRTIRGEESGSWEVESALPQKLAAFTSDDFPDSSGCTKFTSKSFELGTTEPISAVAALSDGSALVAIVREPQVWNRDPPRPATRILRITEEGPSDVTDRFDASIADLRIGAIHQDPSGQIWVATLDVADKTQDLWRGTLETRFERYRAAIPSGWWLPALYRPPSSEELYGVSTCGELHRIDPIEVTSGSTRADDRFTLYDRGGREPTRLSCDIVGAGHLNKLVECSFVEELEGRLLVQTTDGKYSALVSLHRERPLITPIERPATTAGHFKALVKSRSGVFAVESDLAQVSFYRLAGTEGTSPRWDKFIEGYSSQQVRAMHPHKEGFIFAGALGFVTELNPARENPICPTLAGLAGAVSTTDITRLRDGVYLLSGYTRLGDTTVTIIRAL